MWCTTGRLIFYMCVSTAAKQICCAVHICHPCLAAMLLVPSYLLAGSAAGSFMNLGVLCATCSLGHRHVTVRSARSTSFSLCVCCPLQQLWPLLCSRLYVVLRSMRHLCWCAFLLHGCSWCVLEVGLVPAW